MSSCGMIACAVAVTVADYCMVSSAFEFVSCTKLNKQFEQFFICLTEAMKVGAFAGQVCAVSSFVPQCGSHG